MPVADAPLLMTFLLRGRKDPLVTSQLNLRPVFDGSLQTFRAGSFSTRRIIDEVITKNQPPSKGHARDISAPGRDLRRAIPGLFSLDRAGWRDPPLPVPSSLPSLVIRGSF